MPSHRLIHPEAIERLAVIAPQWPSYQGVSQLVGTTADRRCTIYFDPSLGMPALKNAQDLLADADRIMKFNDDTFGVAGGPVNVIVFALGGMTDGTGGADHMGCDYVTGENIEVCASFDQSARVGALFEAELSECSMNNQLCGLSTGEALSRWCAMEVSGNALSDFASAPYWFQNGMENWVDSTDQSDRNYPSIGCGMAFLSWLMGPKHQFSLAEIAQFMVKNGDAGTLSDLYHALTSAPASTSAWTDFQAAIASLPVGVTSDDPFGAMSPSPVPVPAPAPTPTPSPGVSVVQLAILIEQAVCADLSAGLDKPAMKADVQSILDAN